jgi:hypothetical protein
MPPGACLLHADCARESFPPAVVVVPMREGTPAPGVANRSPPEPLTETRPRRSALSLGPAGNLAQHCAAPGGLAMAPAFCRRSYGSLQQRGAMLLCCAVLSAGGGGRLSAQQPPMAITPVQGCSPACQELLASRGKLSSASPGAIQLSAPALLPAVSGLSHAAAIGTLSDFPGDPAPSPPDLGGPVPDIVWQRDSSGDASLWHMSGNGGFLPAEFHRRIHTASRSWRSGSTGYLFSRSHLGCSGAEGALRERRSPPRSTSRS